MVSPTINQYVIIILIGKELLLFESVRDKLSDLLIHSTSALAGYCLQESLITDEVDSKAADLLARLKTGAERASELLRIVARKMNEKMGNTATVWTHFMASIEDMEDVHKYLSMLANRCSYFVCVS